MMRVRLTQIDGKLPNLALMKLAHWHGERGDRVNFTRDIERDLFEPHYDRVYGSAIFSFSAERVARFKQHFPDAIIGGTHDVSDNRTVEQLIGIDRYERYDYSIYGDRFTGSIGFTQRGCRLRCGFCVVPKKEGKARSINTIADIWRGEPWPRHLHLLDNDFFGQPEEDWQARLEEIRRGGFKICLNQGINARMIDEVSATALGSIKDRLFDDGFTTRRLYTAWDNIGDEERFFRGVDMLERHGIRPSMLLVYMLIGYDKRETWERLMYRFRRMAERQIRPYPMIYERERRRGLPLGDLRESSIEIAGRRRWLIRDPSDVRLEGRTLQEFQRWAIRKYYTVIPFEDYDGSRTERLPDWGQARTAPVRTGSDAL
jgi:hypothetical protein